MQEYAICAGYLLPHPPVIVPEVGRGRETEAKKTMDAMNQVAKEIARFRPDTVVLVSPHAPVFSDYVFMYDVPVLKGDLKQFGTGAGVAFEQDGALRMEIERRMNENAIPGGALDEALMLRHRIESALDHGAVVPLYFAGSKYGGFKLVAMSSSALDTQTLYRLGQVIRQSAEALSRRVAIIASGDLSHKVNGESPYGAVPEGAQFDRFLMDALARNDLPGLLAAEPALREKAAECGYRSLVILCGALDGLKTDIRVLSYEAPFGIGYGVAAFTPIGGGAKSALDEARAMRSRNKSESAHVRIARETLESYVREGREQKPEDLCGYADDALLRGKAGVFVSLKKFGELRGCIGTTAPTTGSVMEEIMQNAVSAGTRDPRFSPVTPQELEYLDYSVDVLGEPEPVSFKDELDPEVFGVIVEKGYKRGLLLPDLDGVDTVQRQLEIACGKAGIDPDGDYRILKFTVTRYK